MAKINHIFVVCAAILLFGGRLNSQSRTTLEDQGYVYLNSFQYVKAYEVFDKLHSRYPKEIDYQFKLGICCLNYPEKKARAIEIFKDMKAKYKTLEVEVYLGKAYHKNYKFQEGINTLTPLIPILEASKKKEDKGMLDDVKITIMNCENGKMLMQNKVFADVRNIGPPINTNELEGVPVITADESMMIYTYVGYKSLGGKQNEQMKSDPTNGVFTSDIYMSTKDTSGKWTKPVPMKALNTNGHDACIAISPGGQTLFTFLSNNNNPGDIMVSKLVGNEFTTPVALNANINTTDYWEGSCSISADGKYLYFASERPEGQGGKDIWVSENIEGDWGPAVNLGPKVNTPFDDDAPFIHPDGLTLFFSSKGHTSIGDYDIMFTIKEGNDWTAPKSMGIPLNTTEDDRYYVINSKGDVGYFSSNRTVEDAQGDQDIYIVTPGILGEKPVVALIKGTVYGDDKPIEAKVEVVKTAKNEVIGPYFSNNKTGKYLMALSPGFVYRIKVVADGYETIEEDLDIELLEAYMEQDKDYFLYTTSYLAANPGMQKKSVTTIKDGTLPRTKAEIAAVAEIKKEEAKKEEPTTTGEPKKEEPIAKEEPKKEEPIAKEEPKKEEPIVKEEPKKEEPLVKDEPKKEEPVAIKEKEQRKESEEPVAKTENLSAGKAGKKQGKTEPKTEPTVEEEEPIATNLPCSHKLPNLNNLKGKSLNDEKVYSELLAVAGNYCAEGMVFKVQVGAYKNPVNFTYSNIKSLGKVESESYPDGITRFTQSEFKTLKAAERHRRKAIAKGQKDAWIVAFANGKRYTLEDLIMLDFLGKPIN
jgi:hypothetical protein